jgi:hypothetical protein
MPKTVVHPHFPYVAVTVDDPAEWVEHGWIVGEPEPRDDEAPADAPADDSPKSRRRARK